MEDLMVMAGDLYFEKVWKLHSNARLNLMIFKLSDGIDLAGLIRKFALLQGIRRVNARDSSEFSKLRLKRDGF
jgi:hypothetical protein